MQEFLTNIDITCPAPSIVPRSSTLWHSLCPEPKLALKRRRLSWHQHDSITTAGYTQRILNTGWHQLLPTVVLSLRSLYLVGKALLWTVWHRRAGKCCYHWNKLTRNFLVTPLPTRWGLWATVDFNVHPRTGHEGPEREYRYSFTLSLASALDGVGVQCHALVALPPWKTQHPLYRMLGGPQGQFSQVQKISYTSLITE